MSDIRILLADDHAIVRAGTRQYLETAPDLTVVAEADNGTAAQTLLVTHQPDIAVLDIRMPDPNGIDLTKWIREHCPAVRVLILTAYDDDPYIKAAIEAGASGCMLKTASPHTIIQAVRDIYEGRSFVGPAVAEKLMAAVVSGGTEIIEPLTEREIEVLQWASKGLTNKAIALELSISSRTVQGHLANTYSKLHVSSRTEAVTKAVSLNLIQL